QYSIPSLSTPSREALIPQHSQHCVYIAATRTFHESSKPFTS
ncbi:16950_t:CDS:1, partial [Dentiscutata erythropus]